MNIERVNSLNQDVLKAVNDLLPQLSSSAVPVDEVSLNNILNSKCNHLFIASEGDIIYGMLSLIVFQIPTGTRAWVEDVVVSESARGKGVGKMLIEKALKTSKDLGAKTTDLTSRSSREAANHLYKKCGFVERETNVYRHEN